MSEWLDTTVAITRINLIGWITLVFILGQLSVVAWAMLKYKNLTREGDTKDETGSN